MEEAGTKLITDNRRARYKFDILETVEAGLVLKGSEVKSIRAGKVDLKDSYGLVKSNEAFLLHTYIGPYASAGTMQHEPERMRKLLLHAKEIARLIGKTQEKGLSFVPLKMYFKGGRIKVLMGLGRGKKLYDKRQDIKKRDQERTMAQRLKRGRP